jgi:hypothetical protein
LRLGEVRLSLARDECQGSQPGKAPKVESCSVNASFSFICDDPLAL